MLSDFRGGEKFPYSFKAAPPPWEAGRVLASLRAASLPRT